MPVEVARRWQERFQLPVYEGYGLTETSPFAAYNHEYAHRPGSIGTPIENVERKVVDPTDAVVEDGAWGEIDTLRHHVRQSDVVARIGGEEFVVLFPATTLEQAAAASEKLCGRVREWAWPTLAEGLAVTISAGVAAAEAEPTHEKLLAAADAKLYEARRRGKDRVVA